MIYLRKSFVLKGFTYFHLLGIPYWPWPCPPAAATWHFLQTFWTRLEDFLQRVETLSAGPTCATNPILVNGSNLCNGSRYFNYSKYSNIATGNAQVLEKTRKASRLAKTCFPRQTLDKSWTPGQPLARSETPGQSLKIIPSINHACAWEKGNAQLLEKTRKASRLAKTWFPRQPLDKSWTPGQPLAKSETPGQSLKIIPSINCFVNSFVGRFVDLCKL
jgi:hypothetical protein